ncbi:MAG TPA: phosphotransferase [Acidimicrobiales bacterium]|nr:phosphotransferase [Acidimicrobiales bacterium]
MVEETLEGGVANAGAVTRAGDHVMRPSNPHTSSIHRFLADLRAAGFRGAPLPVGVDPDGRERIEFIPGDVPLAPYPGWTQTDDALASVAELMRWFHDASASIVPRGEWSTEMADPAPHGAGRVVVCHNDVCLENVVFRDGRAMALLDFDFAAPGRPVYDLAQFARMCVPVDDPLSASRLGWADADRAARLRIVADAYGLDDRRGLLDVLSSTIDRGGEFLRRRVEAGDANFIRMWDEIGGMERFDRRRRWWAEHEPEFAAAFA